MSLVTLTDNNFEQEVIKSDGPVFVDFWAEWCQPCKMVRPMVHELAEEYNGKMKFSEIDVDANPNFPQKYGVMSIPTLMIFKGGKPVKIIIGAQPREKFKEVIDSALAS
jgi:thioredoxin 1